LRDLSNLGLLAVDLLETAGFTRLSLGSRALRTETACVAAATPDKEGSLVDHNQSLLKQPF
jgi:hypothetical protein